MKQLFKQYPSLKRHVPLLPIGSFPTPVDHLDSISPRLWVKRDDLSAPEYGGNKIRKLEPILGHVQAKKKQRIVTIGGIGTNHGLASAFYARKLNLSCTLILFHQPLTPQIRQRIQLFHALGADIRYCPSIPGAGLSFYLFSRIQYPNAYFLKGGGSTPLGTAGYVNAAFELSQQVKDHILPKPDVLFCPFGSGGTLAGLALGLRLCSLHTRIIGVQVTPPRFGPFPAITRGTVARLMRSTYNFLKHKGAQLPDVDLTAPEINLGYLGNGYGYATQEGLSAMTIAHQHSSIKLDSTYTAKTFAAVLDHCRNHTGDNILYWHTLSSANLSDYAEMSDASLLPPAVRKLLS